jgi:hypothetical protein
LRYVDIVLNNKYTLFMDLQFFYCNIVTYEEYSQTLPNPLKVRGYYTYRRDVINTFSIMCRE